MKKDETSEIQELFKKAQSGDELSFGKIIDLTQNRLYRFCYYLSSDTHTAQDVCQDTYFKLLKMKTSDFKDLSSFWSWIFKTAKNTYIDFTRNINNQTYEDIENIDFSSDFPIEKLTVKDILLKIDPKYRISLILVDLEGYSYFEASEMIGISEDALRSRLHKARKFFEKKSKK